MTGRRMLTERPNFLGCHDPQCEDSTWDHECPVLPCLGSVVLWPDVEQIDLHCIRPANHGGRCLDEDGGTWDNGAGVESYTWGN